MKEFGSEYRIGEDSWMNNAQKGKIVFFFCKLVLILFIILFIKIDRIEGYKIAGLPSSSSTPLYNKN